MKAFLVDVINKTADAVDVEDDIETYHSLIHTTIIDIVTRNVGGKWFDIICDDIGLFKEMPITSAFDSNNGAALVGNLLFVHHDDEGNTIGISDEDVDHLKSNLVDVIALVKNDGDCELISYPAMFNLDY